MNLLDVVFLALIVVSVVSGFLKGLIREVLSMVGVLLALLVAFLLAPQLAPKLEQWLRYESAAYAAAYLALFLVTMAAAGVISHLFSKLLDLANLGFANRLLGMAFGLLRGTLIALTVLIGLTLFLEPEAPLIRDSAIAPHLTWVGRAVAPLLPEKTREVLLRRLEELPAQEPRLETI